MGSVSLELVLLVPVLMLLTLFVLWAGRGGRAGLSADLAAEEAATAAALCCEEGEAFESDRDALVADMLAARPGLQFLCIGGLRPAADPDRGADAEFVQEDWLEFDPDTGASSGGVGVLGVRFTCETDGAVAPLRGLFPTVTFHGQASEVVVRRPGPPDIGFESSRFIAAEGTGNRLVFTVTSANPVSTDVVVRYEIDAAANSTATRMACPTPPAAPVDSCDYQSLGSTPLEVTIPAGGDEVDIRVSLNDDDRYEGTETLALKLVGLYDPLTGNLLDPVVAKLDANRTAAEGWILDDEDEPYLFIVPKTLPCEVVEADTTLEFEVRLRNQANTADAPSARAVSVNVDTADITTTGGTAPPADYETVSTRITVSPGATTGPIPVPVRILDDANSPVAEPDETFRVALSSPSGAPLGSTAAATCKIIDDEVRVTVAPASAYEGNEVAFELMLDRRPTASFTVQYDVVVPKIGVNHATRGTGTSCALAVAGADYLADSGQVPIPAGHDPLVKVPVLPKVTTCQDDLLEHGETFWLEIDIVAGGEAVAPAPKGAVGTILNDDIPVVSIRPLNPRGTEGDTVSLTVTLDDGKGGTLQLEPNTRITVDYDIAGVGTNAATDPPQTGADYTVTRNNRSIPRSGTLTFTSVGPAAQHDFDIDLQADNFKELTETVQLDLSNLSDPYAATVFEDRDNNPSTDDSYADVAIIDREAPQLYVNNVNAAEGSQLTFTVALCNPPKTGNPPQYVPVTVDYATQTRSATAGLDFTATAGTRTFGATPDPQVSALCRAGTKESKSFDVPVPTLNDLISESDEEVHLVLSNQTAGVVLGKAVGVGRIINVNPATVRVSNPSADEGDNLDFVISLEDDNGNPAAIRSPVSVYYVTADRTATAGPDYASVPYSPQPCRATPPAAGCPFVTFSPTSSVRTGTVTVYTGPDTAVEGDETMALLLQLAPNTDNAGLGDSEGTGTIIDNPVYIRIDDPAGVDEGDTATFTVGLYDKNGSLTSSGATVTVRYATADRTATAGDDYTAASGTVTFSPGDQQKTIDVATLTDSTAEPAETFRVDLSQPTNAVLDRAVGVGTVNADLTPRLSIAGASVRAGGVMSFTVTLDTATVSTVTVDYTTRPVTANSPDDYAAASGTLTFTPGATAMTIDVQTAPNSPGEGDERLQVLLSAPTNAVLWNSSAFGTILATSGPALSIADASAAEGSVMQFRVTLSEAAAQDVTVAYATADRSGAGAATEGDDYLRASGTLTIPAGDLDAYIDVTVNTDSVDEFDETFLVELSSPTNAAIADGTAVGTIDGTLACVDRRSTSTETLPTAAISGTSADEDDGQMDLTVTVSAAMCQDYQFRFQVTGDASWISGTTATFGTDYGQPPPVTLAAGQTAVDFGVPLIDDDVAEGDETFRLRAWSASLPGLRNLAEVEVRPTIVDDDVAELQLPAAGTVSVTEGGWLSFVVRLDRPSIDDVTFDYATSDGSVPAAAAGADYVAVSGTVTIAAGDLSATVAVRTLDDTLDELDENLNLTLSNIVGASPDPDGNTATGVIVDDDPPPSARVSDSAADEGKTLLFTVSLDAASGRDVTLDYDTRDGVGDQGAEAGKDYVARSGTLTFNPGETAKTVGILTLPDDEAESTERMFLDLSSPDGATIADSVGTGQIRDSSDRRISVSDASAVEGGTLAFRVSLSDGASSRDITVRYRTRPGTAAAGVDYDDAHEPLSKELKILAGSTAATVRVPTLQDRLDEDTETLELRLSQPDGAVIVDGTAGGVIIDDDPRPRLRVGDTTAAEADGDEEASATFTLTLSEPSGRDVTVAYSTVDGAGDDGAKAGDDYIAASGSLTIDAGQRQATVTVDLVNDDVAENAETFRLEVSSAVNADLDDAVGIATITDDDGPPQILAEDPADVYEGPGASVTFRVSLSRAAAGVVMVDYATEDGAATAGDDYTAASGTLRFTAGQTVKTLTVPLVNDDIDENAETFRLKLSLRSGNARMGDDTATVLILDDDGLPTLSAADAPAQTEGSTASFTVSLSRASARDVTVAYATRVDPTAAKERAAAPGLDYTATSGTLTIAARSTSATAAVVLLDDSFDEHTETFWLRLSNPTGATVLDGTATGTVNDDDPLPKLAIADGSATEGLTLSFDVRLDARSGRTVTVPWATEELTPGPSSATAGDDYTAASGTVSFSPATTKARLAVASLADDVAESDERFMVRLGTPANSVLDDSVAAGSIRDDDSLPRVSVADASVDEDAGPAVFEVTLSRASSQPVTVAYDTADGTATAPGDYAPDAVRTLVVPAGSTDGEISVAVIDDSLPEGTETFTVTLASAANAVVADGGGTATGTIVDDEGPPRLTVADAEECEDGSSPADCQVRACRVTGHRYWDPGSWSHHRDYCEQNILPGGCAPGQCAGNGTIEFPVELSHAAAEDTSVRYTTFAGTAASPGDYVATAATLTIPAGDTTATISVTLTDDLTDEPPAETFRLLLDNPDGVELETTEAVGTILDDDLAPTVPAEPVVVWANENDGFAYHRVTLSRPSGRTVTVDYSLGGVAYAPAWEQGVYSGRLDCTRFPNGPGILRTCAQHEEYCTAPPAGNRSCTNFLWQDGGTITFAPGVVEQVVAVPVIDNDIKTNPAGWSLPHLNVTYDFNFGNRVNAARAGNGRGRIWDDESPPYVDSVTALDVLESAGEAVFTITLNRVDDQDVTAAYATENGTAQSGSDYTAADSTVTFPEGDHRRHRHRAGHRRHRRGGRRDVQAADSRRLEEQQPHLPGGPADRRTRQRLQDGHHHRRRRHARDLRGRHRGQRVRRHHEVLGVAQPGWQP